ncbi:MAG: hypothetical protein HY303_02780 [Candidatus Wallbacteria bacterium]|nr:hypothetical protein [Candidatus Wallbacteria bacterium]
MATRTEVVQLRVSPAQKAMLKRRARRSGESLSGYILARALPQEQSTFQELLRDLAEEESRSHVLAALHDFLTELAPGQFRNAVHDAELRGLSPVIQNYVAAMVEQASNRSGVEPPGWIRQVTPLEEPFFTTAMRSLRLHLLKSAPVPFKRRNLFIDSGIGKRV